MNQSYLKDSEYKWSDIIILLAWMFFYFFIFLGTRHLSVPDEGRYPEVAREMIQSGNWITPVLNGVPFLDKPALYYWLEAISMSLFGVNAWAIRLPQCLFGVFGTIAIYLFGCKLFNRRTGLIAAFILSTCPLYFFAAHYADMDLEVGNLLWISALFFLLGLQYEYPSKSRRNYMWLAYVFGGFAFLTKGLMGIVFPAAAIGLWIIFLGQWKQIKRLYLVSGFIILIIIVAPWLIAVQIQNPDFFYFFFYYQQVFRYLSHDFHDHMGFWFYFAIILAGMLPWSFLMLCRLWSGWKVLIPERHQNKNLLFITLWIVFITIFFSIPATKLVGYILPVIGPIALLMAVGLNRIIDDGITPGFKITQAIASIFMLGAAIAMLVYPIAQNKFSASEMYKYFIPGAIFFTLGALYSWYNTYKNKTLYSVITIAISMVVFNICALLSVPIFDIKTDQPLTNVIKPLLKKDSVVVSYDGYSEDIPLLLQRKVYIAYGWHEHSIVDTNDWAQVFYYGIQEYQSIHHQWPKWYIELTAFPDFWKDHNSIFVITSEGEYHQLVKELNINTKLLGEYNGNVAFMKVK